MKKILLVLLAILLAFSIIACDEESNPTPGSSPVGNSTNTSGSGDGNTDASQPGNTDNPGDQGGNKDTTGLILTKAVIAQLESAASMKLEIALDLDLEDTYWYQDKDGEAVEEKDTVKNDATFSVYIAKSENGYDLKVEANVVVQEGEETDEALNGGVLYIVDGAIYAIDTTLDVYVKTEIPEFDTTKIEEVLNTLLGDIEIPEEEIESALNDLGNMLIEGFGIADNKGSSYVDFKPMYDSILEYINSIDPETDTLKSLINDSLALVYEDLTVDAFLEAIKEYGSMTVAEAIEAVEAMLAAEYEMTIQELYDTLVANEKVQYLLGQYVISMNPEATEEEINAFIDQVASIKLLEMIPEELMSHTLYDLFASMIVGENSKQEMPEDGTMYTSEEVGQLYPTLDETIAMVNAYLDMTIAELEATAGFTLDQIKGVFDMFVLNEYNVSLDIEFTDVFLIKSIVSEINLDIVVSTPSGSVQGKTNVTKTVCKMTATLKEISNEAEAIEVPTDKQIIADIFGGEFYTENGERVWVSSNYDGTVDVNIEIGLINFDINVELDCIDYNVITIKAGEAEVSGTPLPAITITLDVESGTAVIEGLELPSTCEHDYSQWEDDGNGGAYRVCVHCGEYDYQ